MDLDEELGRIVTGEQPLSEEEKALRDEAYARLDLWERECKDYHDEAMEMRQVLRLKDPRQDVRPLRKGEEPTLQLHTLANTVYNSVAEQMERMPEVKLLPESPEMEELADQLQDVLHYIVYSVNDYDTVHRRRMEDLYTTGTAVLQVAWDPEESHGKGDVALIRWPIEAMVWDPQAEDIQDARAVMKVSWHPLSWYQAHYPDAAPYVRADEHTHNDVGMPESQREDYGQDEDRALLVEYWYRTYDARKKRYAINVAYFAGNALLEWSKDVYAHGEYPFIFDAHSYIEGVPVGTGMVGEFRSMMQYINKYAKYIDTNLRMSSKGRMLVRRESGIDRRALADWSQDMIEGNAIQQGVDWNWLQHAPLNGVTMQQMQQMQQNLQQDAGVSSVMRGVLPSDYASGKAVVALQETGSKISQLRTTSLRAGFKHAVEQMLWLIAQFYDDQRIALITGKDGQTRAVRMDMKGMFGKKGRAVPPPPYVVQIEINNKNPLRIDQQNEMFMQAYTMAAQAQQQFPLSVLFSMLNVEGKDRILPALEAAEQQQQMMQQMAQQMEQMAGKLQAAQKENAALRRAGQQMSNTLSNIEAQGGMAGAEPEEEEESGMAQPEQEEMPGGMGEMMGGMMG